jgi:eukaryotic-like serine/threonine-protein kinase
LCLRVPELEKGRVIRSPITERRYRLGGVIGRGGYGKAFQATDLERHRPVCLKYTYDQQSWQRECYFGELLHGKKRVIQVYDSFPVMPRSGRGRIRYCLVLELAEHGTLADYIARTGHVFSALRAKKEIAALLRVLDQLHDASATHRDITPYNVFVCAHGALKLGDFGIARHELAGLSNEPEAFNPDFVTAGVVDAEHPEWTRADDVYQMGHLLAMLLLGKLRRVPPAQLARAGLDPKLEALIKRATGPRRRRYRDAGEMLEALRKLN